MPKNAQHGHEYRGNNGLNDHVNQCATFHEVNKHSTDSHRAFTGIIYCFCKLCKQWHMHSALAHGHNAMCRVHALTTQSMHSHQHLNIELVVALRMH